MDKFTDLHKRILEFRESRDWKQFHTPENLSKSIVIEAGELLENFQWGDEYKSEDVIDELADIMIYSILLADSLGVDAIKIMEEKIQRNEKRFPVDRVKGNSGKHTRVEIND